jgi:hypothetical protein
MKNTKYRKDVTAQPLIARKMTSAYGVSNMAHDMAASKKVAKRKQHHHQKKQRRRWPHISISGEINRRNNISGY